LSESEKSGRSLPEDSLLFRTEVRFLGKDHVGSVKHFEGIQISTLTDRIRRLTPSLASRYDDETIEINGNKIYTNVAQVGQEGDMYLWIKGTEVEEVGVVVEVKVFHETEASAVADELLARVVSELEGMLT
jgi:hypothetical protein